jgi:hypothetical protein
MHHKLEQATASSWFHRYVSKLLRNIGGVWGCTLTFPRSRGLVTQVVRNPFIPCMTLVPVLHATAPCTTDARLTQTLRINLHRLGRVGLGCGLRASVAACSELLSMPVSQSFEVDEFS